MNSPRLTHAFAREVSRSLERCELLYVPRQPFDLPLARRQHAAYISTLEAAGINVTVLPEEPDMPDSCFVEDPAIVLDEVAVICRPGAASRAREVESIERALASVARPSHCQPRHVGRRGCPADGQNALYRNVQPNERGRHPPVPRNNSAIQLRGGRRAAEGMSSSEERRNFSGGGNVNRQCRLD